MRRTIIPILTLGVTLGALAACGGSDGDDATDEYRDRAEEVGNVSTSVSPGSVSEEMLVAIQAVEAAAPDDIKAAWTTYANAFEDNLESLEIAKNPKRSDEGMDLARDALDAMIPATEAVLAHLSATCDF